MQQGGSIAGAIFNAVAELFSPGNESDDDEPLSASGNKLVFPSVDDADGRQKQKEQQQQQRQVAAVRRTLPFTPSPTTTRSSRARGSSPPSRRRHADDGGDGGGKGDEDDDDGGAAMAALAEHAIKTAEAQRRRLAQQERDLVDSRRTHVEMKQRLQQVTRIPRRCLCTMVPLQVHCVCWCRRK